MTLPYTRVFTLVVCLVLSTVIPAVSLAQDPQPMNEIPLGNGGSEPSGMSAMTMTETTSNPGGTTTTNSGPEALAFDGTHVWVASQFTDKLTKVRVSDGAIAGTFTVGRRPVALLYAGGSVWVANLLSNNVMRLNKDTGAIVGTY